VQRFLADAIVAEYFDVRTTLLNAIANLRKERLTKWIPTAIEVANGHLDDPIERTDVDRYYAKDQRLWAVLQWLRRVDRWWQLQVRRRPYPVLLPGRIDR
jgi:DNA-binding GntR family transcriptional regulator